MATMKGWGYAKTRRHISGRFRGSGDRGAATIREHSNEGALSFISTHINYVSIYLDAALLMVEEPLAVGEAEGGEGGVRTTLH